MTGLMRLRGSRVDEITQTFGNSGALRQGLNVKAEREKKAKSRARVSAWKITVIVLVIRGGP
jgi:hypothetical protein